MSKITKKIISVITGLMVTVWLIGPGIAYGLTAEELQVQIDALLAQLTTLQTQLAALEGTTAPAAGVPAACTGITSFDRNLKAGMSGADVKCLQALLNTDSATKVASSGAGSPGNETMYFGPLTKAAVIKFQEKYASAVLAPWGLTAGTGFVGSTTRAKLGELLTAAPPVGEEEEEEEEEVTTTYEVMLASDNPASGTLGASSAYNTVLKAKVKAGTADRSITSVTIERFGLSVDTNVSGVLVVDENGKRHGNVLTFAENVATITFTDDPIKVETGKSAVFSVQLHMASTATAGTLGVKVTGMSNDPTGLPLTGNLFTLTGTTGVLGSLTADVVSQTTATVNVDIGTTDYVLTKFRFTGGANEDVKITKLVLFQNGTAADADLKNWDLVDPNGTVLATVEQPINKTVTFDLGDSYTIPKGTTRDLTVRVDVLSGSARTGQIIIQNDYDIMAKGASTGLGVLPTAAGSIDTAFPIGDIASGSAGYNHLTVAAGTLTVSKSSTSPSGTFGIGAAGITLAVWELEAKGEDIQIQRADLAIGGTVVAGDLAGTIKLQTDGGQTLYSVAPGSAASLLDGDAAGTDVVTFASYYTIPAGTVLKLKLVIDASSSVSGGDTAIGRISDIYYKRMTSNTYSTGSAGSYISGNTLTASAASLTLVNNAAYGNTTVISGQSNVLMGSYLLQTGSSEGVNISSIAVTMSSNTGLSNLKLKRTDTGVQLGSTIASPAAAANTFTVSGQLNIAANTTIQLDVYGNLSTSATGNYTSSIAASGATGVGATSGTTINAPTTGVTGRTLAVTSSGTLTISIETSGAASSQFYSAGLTGIEMGRLKLAATVEDMKIQTLVLRTINGSGNIANVKLLGTGLSSDPSTPLTAGQATFTFSTGGEITVPAYGSKVLTVVVDTTGVGTIVAGNHGVVGFGTADALGSGSGVTVQERLTGTVEVAGTNNFAGGAGDIIYFTATATDGTGGGAAANTAAGFYMVTTVGNVALTTGTGSLTLQGDADDVYWATGDVVTTLTKVESILGNANAGTAYNVGDLVYVYDSDDNEAGFAIVTTAVASGSAISGLGFSPAGSVAISAAGDRVTKLTNANALAGNTMRYEEVEPVIALASNSPSGSSTPGSEQTVGIFNVTASGYRDMTFNSLTIEKAGSNSPYRYVSKLSLWNGSTKLAEVDNTTKAGVADTALTVAVIGGTTGLEFCTTDDGGAAVADEVSGISSAEWASIAVGDKLVFSDGTDEITATVATKGTLSATCDGTVNSTDNITFSSISQTTGTGAVGTAVNLYNYRVHFNASQADTNDTALSEQTVTAGQTMTLTVKADTSSVKTGVTSGTVTFSVSVPGVAGPLQVAATQIEGLNWDYTPLGSGTAVYKTEGDSYPVTGNTLIY